MAGTHPDDGAPSPDFHVAIIGGGITGINLALGLQARGVQFTLYERAPGFREIGAGIGFSPNAEVAMTQLDPSVLASYKRVSNPNGEDYFQWVNGVKSDSDSDTDSDTENKDVMYKLYVGKDGFQGCRRSDVLEEWAKLLQPERVQFGKQVDTIVEPEGDADTDKLTITFTDGSTATADVVVGCDGIRSRVRQLILGADTPAAHPHYSAKFCFRALVPMEAAVAAVGAYRAGTRFMYNGPGAHVITYPIGGNAVLNVLVVLSDPHPWPDAARHTAAGTRREVADAFVGWRRTVREIVALLPDEMDKWAVFDMAEHPAPTFFRGRVAVAGDAAHATGPHLGAGGGLGIEDALVLAELLRAVAVQHQKGDQLVQRALAAYTAVRFERTQAVVQATREAVDLFQWRDPAVGADGERFGQAITPKFYSVWNYDVVGSVAEALGQFHAVPN